MIKLYYHGGSENHGCEAIVRSTAKVFNGGVVLCTKNRKSDEKYSIDALLPLEDDIKNSISKTEKIISAVDYKLNHRDYLYTKFTRKAIFNNVSNNDIYMSIGGDNYCYAGKDILGYYNKLIHNKGAKTVFWGCSFEPKDMNDKIARDISLYDLIVTRESISYELLKSVNPNTVLVCDPAFQLDSVELPLPKNFISGNTVGINVSPLIMKYESNEGATIKNYELMIAYIIKNTNMNIALIPHVVEYGNDDREALNILYDKFSETNRICMIDDCNAMELKGYISRCRFFIGARTHATIAAYSTDVPTVVVGYSVKARGIAKDIFGSEDNYVIPVQKLKNDDDLKNAFIWLEENEYSIRNHLKEFIPDYKKTIYKAADMVKGLIK